MLDNNGRDGVDCCLATAAEEPISEGEDVCSEELIVSVGFTVSEVGSIREFDLTDDGMRSLKGIPKSGISKPGNDAVISSSLKTS